MINKSTKESIKSIIGHRYAAIIQKELIDSNTKNKDGVPYSRGHISNVMNGEKHEIIEAAIYRVVEKRLKAQTKRGHILNKKSAVGNEDL
jgi:hypothetical protein|tara:strand:+ start:17311 stop:17580 length:270 start_codon:yes stop_codon:yes gene_type:complete